ncbi:MAG: SH3 domain-containing protein [Chloroflexi bacterium]|nr:SH3 domain-containing protein [Chloroflexota bacterium]
MATIGLTGCPGRFAGYLPAFDRRRLCPYRSRGTAEPNLRSAPSLDAEQLGLIAPGTTVEVLDGPVCEATSQIVWW